MAKTEVKRDFKVLAEKISPETVETKAETAAEAVTQESSAPETVEEEVTPAAEAEKAVNTVPGGINHIR